MLDKVAQKVKTKPNTIIFQLLLRKKIKLKEKKKIQKNLYKTLAIFGQLADSFFNGEVYIYC